MAGAAFEEFVRAEQDRVKQVLDEMGWGDTRPTNTERHRRSRTAPEDVPDRSTVLASAAFGALMLVAAVLVIVDAVRLPETSRGGRSRGRAVAGRRAARDLRRRIADRARAQLSTAPRETTWQPRAGLRLLGMVVALVAFAVLLPILGYVVSSAALFVAAAMLLGAPKFWRTVAYGWALAAIVFLVFDRLIGLSLPTGPWGF